MASALEQLRAQRAAKAAATAETTTPPAAATQAQPADTATPEGGLDFNDEQVRDFSDKDPRIPWDIAIKCALALTGLVHVNGRNSTFYKATVTVIESDSDQVLPDQNWSLLYYYVPHPRTDGEKFGNDCSARELRALAAAVAGTNPKDPSFNANAEIGKLQKRTNAGEKLVLPFEYQQQPYVKDGKKKSKTTYKPFE